MSFGLSFEKLLIIALIAVILIGPERLPSYAATLARWTRSFRAFANGAKDRIRDEMGPEFDEVDWKKLDPRQYDPRRIILNALTEDEEPPIVRAPRPSAAATRSETKPAVMKLSPSDATPFDSEAT